jgi:hypothetical protein
MCSASPIQTYFARKAKRAKAEVRLRSYIPFIGSVIKNKGEKVKRFKKYFNQNFI